ncbi:MAG: polymerase [Gemmatimonadales bacterium]|jgi:RNA-directed DNA polymerase|nr:polymerase [Gemmatimonadales bacterium]
MAEHNRAMATVRQRDARRQKGLANLRLVRYADDWVAMVNGTREDAERLREQPAAVLAPMGLRPSEGHPHRYTRSTVTRSSLPT